MRTRRTGFDFEKQKSFELAKLLITHDVTRIRHYIQCCHGDGTVIHIVFTCVFLHNYLFKHNSSKMGINSTVNGYSIIHENLKVLLMFIN